MQILVSGAAGFLGSHLCERLIAQGHSVIGLDNFITGRTENLSSFKSRPNFSFIEHDICKPLPFSQPLDRVYHLASPASPIDYIDLPFETMYVNADGTRNMLEIAKHCNARFFLASTSEVYGDPHVHPQVESYWGNVNPIGPRSVYDEGKRYAEALTMAYHRYRNVAVRIVRIFNTYGPRMRANDGRVVPTFINQALNQKPLTIFGDGLQTRSFCYVSDLISGFIALMESSITGPCNIGNPQERTMLDLAEAINKYTENEVPHAFKPLPKDDPTRRKPNISLAQKELGWEPQVSFEDGIQRTIAWFRDNPDDSSI
ncbi:MAG: UDP-glucuronic acid decarboxylase family protein [Myxococcota bacterium]